MHNMEENKSIQQEPVRDSSAGDNHSFSNAETTSEKASFIDRLKKNERLFAALRITLISITSFLSVLALIVFILYLVPVIQEIPSGKGARLRLDDELHNDAGYKKEIAAMTKDIQKLSRKYNSYTSGQSYIVINTTDNRFYLYKNRQLVREGFCSSGSYTLLQSHGDKQWVFKTPKGKYKILGKTTNPVWKKPDWAFVEEGLPIPSANHESRYEYGVLGDYALSIGDGYMIHGTIYKRFLGMPVTHGCVRLNDEDLEAVFNTLNYGSKVFIF